MTLSKAWAAGVKDSASGTILTTGTFDSTGYTHLVVTGMFEEADTTITFSDNKSSSGWANLTKQANGDASPVRVQMGWVKIGTPGTGHTATMTLGAARPWRGVHVWLVNATSGDIALDVESTATGVNANPDAGSLVTSNTTVMFMSVGPFTGSISYTPGSVDNVWDEDFDPATGTDFSYAQSRGPAGGGAYDPVCTCTGSQDWAAVSAAFKEVSLASILKQMMAHHGG